MEGVSSQRAVKNRVKLDDGQNLDVGEHNIYWVCLVQHVQGVQDFNVQCDEELKEAVALVNKAVDEAVTEIKDLAEQLRVRPALAAGGFPHL